jgi:hypothetical protein
LVREDERARPDDADASTPISWSDEWQRRQGHRVGRLARQALGAGRMLPPVSDAQAVTETRAALDDDLVSLVFEATFRHAAFVARADVLRRAEHGWDVIEVKSGKAPKPGEAPSESYLADLAYTVALARATGVDVQRCTLMLLARNYRAPTPMRSPDSDVVADPDVRALFTEVDVTESVLALSTEYLAMFAPLETELLSDRAAPPVFSWACKGCDYYGTPRCLHADVDDPLFDLPRLSAKAFQELAPFERLSRIPDPLPKPALLTKPQQEALAVRRSGRPKIHEQELATLDTIVWPVYYLDFETASTALPWFAGDAPYEQLPTQYSVHRCDREDGPHAHADYFAPLDGTDWRESMLVALLDVLGTQGTIVHYSSFEKQVLNAFATRFPPHTVRIDAIIERLVDLEPVVKKGYIHPGFRGRSSIKQVLPVMVPTLSYDGMAVAEGMNASALFQLLWEGARPQSEVSEHSANLRAYCALDTLAMLRLHDALLDVQRRAP